MVDRLNFYTRGIKWILCSAYDGLQHCTARHETTRGMSATVFDPTTIKPEGLSYTAFKVSVFQKGSDYAILKHRRTNKGILYARSKYK